MPYISGAKLQEMKQMLKLAQKNVERRQQKMAAIRQRREEAAKSGRERY